MVCDFRGMNAVAVTGGIGRFNPIWVGRSMLGVLIAREIDNICQCINMSPHIIHLYIDIHIRIITDTVHVKLQPPLWVQMARASRAPLPGHGFPHAVATENLGSFCKCVCFLVILWW